MFKTWQHLRNSRPSSRGCESPHAALHGDLCERVRTLKPALKYQKYSEIPQCSPLVGTLLNLHPWVLHRGRFPSRGKSKGLGSPACPGNQAWRCSAPFLANPKGEIKFWAAPKKVLVLPLSPRPLRGGQEGLPLERTHPSAAAQRWVRFGCDLRGV